MSTLTIQTTLAGVAVNGLAVAPTISVRRADTDAVVASGSMVDTGVGGIYNFEWFPDTPSLNYYWFADADPLASGQTDVRTYGNSFDLELTDLWNDHGLNSADIKEIVEITEGANYTETANDQTQGPDVEKTVVKIGDTTTITRLP